MKQIYCLTIALMLACSAHAAQQPTTNSIPHTDKMTLSHCQAKQATNPLACDKAAIRAMAGGYRVNFDFYEVTALLPNYELKPSKSDGADEMAHIIYEDNDTITIQHILEVGDGNVVKHWRQDWTYEPKTLWQYEGKIDGVDTWQRYRLTPKQRKGAWLQTVWQVDDSPRYASLGTWQHDKNSHIWQGHATNRPLPRREHSTRDDYDVLYSQNSHDIGTTGWVHLQNNLKEAGANTPNSRYIAREIAMNTYEKDDELAFGDAKAYWQETAPFWAVVRAYWADIFAKSSKISTVKEVNDSSMYEVMFKAADDYAKQVKAGSTPTEAALKKQVVKLVSPFVNATPVAADSALPVLSQN